MKETLGNLDRQKILELQKTAALEFETWGGLLSPQITKTGNHFYAKRVPCKQTPR